MNKAYKNFKSMLMVVDYHFQDDNNEKEITLDTKEKIEIKSIGDTSLLLLAERKLIFNGLTNTYLKVSYEVNILGQTHFIARQGIALLALIPIWLYKGKQGYHSKNLQSLYYVFYPLHLFVLGILKFL